MNFESLLNDIKAGKFTPAQMEDMVNAMHTAYEENHPNVMLFMVKSPEDYAIEMYEARECVTDSEEPSEFDICPSCNGSGEGVIGNCTACNGKGTDYFTKWVQA